MFQLKNGASKSKPKKQESIIEKEIRLQAEREHELMLERKQVQADSDRSSVSPSSASPRSTDSKPESVKSTTSTTPLSSRNRQTYYSAQHPIKADITKAKQREDELKIQRQLSQGELGQGQSPVIFLS